MKIKNNIPFQVVVNGQSYDARVENAAANPLVVFINGNQYTVEFAEDAVPAAVAQVSTASAPTAVPSMPVHPVKSAAQAPAAGVAINAPMPGTVQGICVKVGQAVKRGDQLCLLEAMKMKNAIRSPRDGVIASIEVADEQKVTYDAPMFTLK